MLLRAFRAISVGFLVFAYITGSHAKPEPAKEELQELAREVYIYAYPLVLMHVTRETGTNVATPIGMRAPVNQFAHAKEYPDWKFTDIVRPNADTLYSALHYDVSKEPLIFEIPDSGGRYYLLPFMDAWTDVFAAPGSRTTGTQIKSFALTGPNWKGKIPPGVTVYRSPTATGFLIGRTQTNGKADYGAVHDFQNKIKVYPLSFRGKNYTPQKSIVKQNQNTNAPPDIVEKMSPEEFFTLFVSLLKENQPHENDYPILDRMNQLGLVPEKKFDFKNMPKEIKDALSAAPKSALAEIKNILTRAGIQKNGWRINLNSMGTYGTNYLQRAGVAFAGLGANLIEDAIYPTVVTDIDGELLNSDRKYVLHFKKDQQPPVRAFWSLTMYDNRQLFTKNPIGRYAIGDRDNLMYNKDGSLDIYIQKDSPGKGKESNWLPAPQNGNFTMNMRLYWPKPTALTGTWAPPPVQRVSNGQSLSATE